MTFNVDGEKKTVQADLIVGADGIRSTVRKQLIGEERTPLRYLAAL
ncbi:2-polyprenyl-6-methoxyphenol hydroxylase [Nonlabens ulvanivorans]|nr:2-polyprenyl-6-methoxyphenol hydroxylase [Nonlabens ulvanivorans]